MSDFHDLNILLVDDEKEIRLVVRKHLAKFESVIFEAASAEFALNILKKETIDLAILDIRMPGMDGLELLRKIRELYPEVLTIMLTGYGDRANVLKALKLHVFDFLEKPLDREILINRVHNALKICYLKRFFNSTLRDFLAKHCDKNILAQFDRIWNFLLKN